MVLQTLKRFVSQYIIRRSAISMWEKRARHYGERAVFHLGHSEEEMEAVTRMQKEKIFPILKSYLTGNERVILDLGCGPGRFTENLAEIIQGKAIGVDPIQHFLDIAPKGENVEYRLMKESTIPAEDESMDVVWICLVLGGIVKSRVLGKVVAEVNRVLKPNGLIILTENTSDTKDGEYWKFRSIEYYQNIFHFAGLKYCDSYIDLGQRNAIFSGTKLSTSGNRANS